MEDRERLGRVEVVGERVVELAEERETARAARDFERADRLRDSIDAQGWEVRDVEGGFQLVPK